MAEGGSRILMIPFNMNSHYLFFSKLAVELARLGDEVSMVVASNNHAPLPRHQQRFHVLTFQSSSSQAYSDSQEMQDSYYQFAMDKSLWNYYDFFKKKFRPTLEEDGRNMVYDQALMTRLREGKFDFAIFDSEPMEYFQVISKHLNIPYATLNIPILPWMIGVPRLPSVTSNFLLAYPPLLTFKERLLSFCFDMFLFLIATYTPVKAEWKKEAMDKFQVEVHSATVFHQNASLTLYLEDSVVSFPQANMPYSISVGDIVLATQTSPLPQDLALFVQQGPTILVSFGSFIYHLPAVQTDKFCSAFAAAKEFNFVWKFKNASVCGDSLHNLLVRPWLPQNDLLARATGFISHGGFNSVMESIYHATPLIIFPLAVDQHHQASMAEVKGFGIQMDLADWSVEKLLSNIGDLSTGTYKEAASRHSAILKHRQLPAARKVSHAVEHVVKFGSDHLKNPSKHLYWFQTFMFDVLLFGLLLVCLFVTLLLLVVRFLFRKCFSSAKAEVKQNKKGKVA